MLLNANIKLKISRNVNGPAIPLLCICNYVQCNLTSMLLTKVFCITNTHTHIYIHGGSSPLSLLLPLSLSLAQCYAPSWRNNQDSVQFCFFWCHCSFQHLPLFHWLQQYILFYNHSLSLWYLFLNPFTQTLQVGFPCFCCLHRWHLYAHNINDGFASVFTFTILYLVYLNPKIICARYFFPFSCTLCFVVTRFVHMAEPRSLVKFRVHHYECFYDSSGPSCFK